MSKELDIQIGLFNRRPDIQIGMAKQLKNFGIDLSGSGYKNGLAKIEVKTSAEWENYIQYIPEAGRIIVYSDRRVINGVAYPGIKIADGLAYVVDLPFVGDDASSEFMSALENHVNDHVVHITEEERQFWNNKINYNFDEQGENLILNRD